MAEYTLLPQRENLHGVLDPALPPALRVRSRGYGSCDHPGGGLEAWQTPGIAS